MSSRSTFSTFVDWFKQSKGKTIVANVGWQLATKAVTTLLALAAAGFVARRLGPEGFGIYRNAQAVAGLLASFGIMVAHSVMVKRLVSEPHQEGVLLGSAMRVVGAAGFLALAIATFVPWTFDGADGRWVVVAATCYFAIYFMVPMAAWFEAHMEGKVLATSNMAGLVLTRAWEIGCSLIGVGVAVFALSNSLGLILMSVIVGMAFRRRAHAPSHLPWSWGVAKSLLLASLPWAALGFVNHAQMRCELFFLTAFKGTAAGGQYSAGGELVQPFLVIPGFLMSALFPSVIRSFASDQALGEARMAQYYKLSAGIGIACALGMCLLAPPMAHLIYGSKFDEVAHIIRILAWYMVPAFLAGPSVAWMVKEELGWLAAVYSVSGLVITVVLDLLMIPTWGVIGAAIVTPLAALIINAVLPVFHPRTRWLAVTQWKALAWPIPNLHAIIPSNHQPK